MAKKAIIIGAGPAGLTAAYELLTRTDIKPIILEKSGDIGGISKTVNYKGNRMDIGGHRFFSKSDRVMKWWLNILPLAETAKKQVNISYHNKTRELNSDLIPQQGKLSNPDMVMLVRKRLSRIYFLRQFFTYPISLSIDTLRKLGIGRTAAILFSYIKAQLLPRKPEKNLEDFMVNRFGKTLYELFFRDYTEKVWGVPCNKIPPEWGAQRIKGVSISKAIAHAIRELTRKKIKNTGDIAQKDTETSLIEQFLYPKLGPGQLWEEVARQVVAMGGEIHMNCDVKHIYPSQDQTTINSIHAVNQVTGENLFLEGDYFFSTMPVKDLIAGMGDTVPTHVQEIASGLQYRDFITVGILLSRLSTQDPTTGEWKQLELKDNWIYIQDACVKVGRLQLFHNWSPFMVADPETVWVGMEFFCNETDGFWKLHDIEIQTIAIQELEKIGLISASNVLDSTVLRVEKTYPAYFGAYARFDEIRSYTDQLENLFLVGRNGMHKYNNADHSMLTAMVAVDNIEQGITAKANLWEINTEQEYHEEKADTPSNMGEVSAAPATFKAFLLKKKANKQLLWFAFFAALAQFIIFKFYYPSAGFIDGDSYVYLESAYGNFSINTYPIGYSKFLRFFSIFTIWDTALVAFQYFFVLASCITLVFTLSYFYKISKVFFGLLFITMLFNPVLLYVSNYVSSDALFLGLSLLWFISLLWIINRPSRNVIIAHALLILFAFTVRYNALIYPIISVVAFLISRQSLKMKVIGMASGFLLVAGFMYHTSNQYKRLTNIRQFTPFSGWQIANNALYTYRFVQDQPAPDMPAKFKPLDKMVRTYFDTAKNTAKDPQEMLIANTWYMWDPKSPLQKYMRDQFAKDSTATTLKKWASVAPLFTAYGNYLIRKYPIAFARYYMLPNFYKYYAPPVEFLDTYNMGKDSISPIAKNWFGYDSRKLKKHFKDQKVTTLNFFPIFTGITYALFAFCVFGYFVLNGYKNRDRLFYGMILMTGLWLINMVFSIYASPVALRFQLFPILTTYCFVLIQLDYIIRKAFIPTEK